MIQFQLVPAAQLSEDLKTWLVDASQIGFNWSESASVADFKLDYSYYLVGIQAGGAPIGFIAYHLLFGQADINRVYVVSAYRRQKIAQQLFNQLFKQARQSDIDSFILEVADNNAPALSVYRKAGFQTIDRRKDYYPAIPADALIMTYDMEEEPACD